MADIDTRSSPHDPLPGRLQLTTSHTGLLFRSPTVSVYYHRQPPFTSKGLTYSQSKTVVAFEPAAGVLHHFCDELWRHDQIVGRSLFFFPPNVAHEVRWDSEAEMIEIYYESDFLQELRIEDMAVMPGHGLLRHAADDPLIWELALAICLWSADGAPASSAITDLGALIGKRLFLRRPQMQAMRSGPQLTPELRRRLDDYIQANMANRFGVPHLAKVVALSEPHFTMLCRNTTGKPPMEYVRECRLRKAHAMARSGQYRCREIARACGFYDGSHLNREFKKIFRHPLAPLLKGDDSKRCPNKA